MTKHIARLVRSLFGFFGGSKDLRDGRLYRDQGVQRDAQAGSGAQLRAWPHQVLLNTRGQAQFQDAAAHDPQLGEIVREYNRNFVGIGDLELDITNSQQPALVDNAALALIQSKFAVSHNFLPFDQSAALGVGLDAESMQTLNDLQARAYR